MRKILKDMPNKTKALILGLVIVTVILFGIAIFAGNGDQAPVMTAGRTWQVSCPGGEKPILTQDIAGNWYVSCK